MKNTIKLIGIIALTAVIGLNLIACDDSNGNSDGVEISGTATVNSLGLIRFCFVHETLAMDVNPSISSECHFTTDLPSPNDSFDVRMGVTNQLTIRYLTPGTIVKWTAKIDKGSRLERYNPNKNEDVTIYGYAD